MKIYLNLLKLRIEYCTLFSSGHNVCYVLVWQINFLSL